MNQYSEVESHDYVLDEFYDETQYCQSAEYSEEYYILESRIYLQNQYYGRWAAEKWLLRLCLYRCCRFLLSRFRLAKPTESTSDYLPF